MTRKYAVVGSPISHSKSPIIHRAIFKQLGVDAEYSAHEVTELVEFLNAERDIAGLSLTMPLKDQAFRLATELDSWAERTGAVNTLLRTESGWSGFNTDVFGLQQASNSVKFETVTVLGTGATARSALVAFHGAEVTLWGRNEDSATRLAEEFACRSAQLNEALSADLVVSTLPGDALLELIPRQSVYPGTFLSASYAVGSNSSADNFNGFISGLEMLMWQAVGQGRIFTGIGPGSPMKDEEKLVEVLRVALDMTK